MRHGQVLIVIAAAAIVSHAALAQWNQPQEISRPPANMMWGMQHEGADHCLIPYDVIDRMAHKKLRKMIGGLFAGEGYLFFVVAIDNTKGKSPVTFSTSEATIALHCEEGGMQQPSSYYIVDMRDHFADPDNTPPDKEVYEKVKGMFRPNLNIPPGKTGWSLVAYRDTIVFEHLNKIEWPIPGAPPKTLSARKYDPAIIKKLGIEVVPWD